MPIVDEGDLRDDEQRGAMYARHNRDLEEIRAAASPLSAEPVGRVCSPGCSGDSHMGNCPTWKSEPAPAPNMMPLSEALTYCDVAGLFAEEPAPAPSTLHDPMALRVDALAMQLAAEIVRDTLGPENYASDREWREAIANHVRPLLSECSRLSAENERLAADREAWATQRVQAMPSMRGRRPR